MNRPLLYTLIILMLCCSCTSLQAQYYNQESGFIKANSVWVFGQKAGMDFNTGLPFTSAVDCWEGAASVADPRTGALLFYCAGPICFNRDHMPMPNGDSLLGNSSQPFNVPGSTIQGVCIVPVIGTPHQYYIFSLRGASTAAGNPPMGGNLFYSIVDMSLDGGKGDIVPGQKNIPLNTALMSEGMIAIPGTQCDIWLMVHLQTTPVFLAYHITASGLNPVPIATPTASYFSSYSCHSMAVTSDLKRMAVAEWGFNDMNNPGGLLIYKLDRSTGTVSDPVHLGGLVPNGTYIPAFSPDGSKLYVTYRAHPEIFGSGIDILQYDVSSHDSLAITASKVLVGRVDTTGNLPGYLRQYNGKIYITSACPFLHTINKPDLAGLACDFQINSVPLLHQSRTGLPAEVLLSPVDTAFNQQDTASLCIVDGNQQPVVLSADAGSEYHWNDGSTERTLTVKASGVYWVSYKDQCRTRVDTFAVKEHTLSLDLGPDTLLCDESGFTLNADFPGASYLWQDGSTGSRYAATQTGRYWARIENEGCTASDTVSVRLISCHCGFNVPNAFSPNGDGINDQLLPVIAPDCRVQHFAFAVFNRYGQRVYLSNDPAKGWNGYFNNRPADPGTYFYELSFSGGIRQESFYRKGDVVLLR
ncbi:gliding motility-associated C-terminal domain-containing protein [Taibaiella koreensis]|uniref:gliding motility-associated C-terminal domain-containing protein n=1 Tax=Taibaiella koreensis TaxID=1268548 RepID=UPI000E5A0BA5|nr:gliding motility-associated C-terminal domain-containing protein [Taibaiella koreensis]